MRSSILSAVLLLAAISPSAFAEIPISLTDASVLIDSGRGSGSGVLFKHGDCSFVWTAAHVIPKPQAVTVLDRHGKEKTVYRFGRVGVVQVEVEKGEKVGETFHYASVLRWSRRHDLALLLVSKRGYGRSGVEFYDGVPKLGSRLWHVGSMHGYRGIGSVADGTFAFAGRLRLGFGHNEQEGIIWDQISGVAHPGSSGGGVFLQHKQQCIGLVTDFLMGGPEKTFGAYCITPSRRIIAYAREQKAAWAVDRSVKLPSRKLMFRHPALDEPLPADTPAIPIPFPVPSGASLAIALRLSLHR